MADISTQIAAIMSAVYGEEVRGSIRDALNAINADPKYQAIGICETAGDVAQKEITAPIFDYTVNQFLIIYFKNNNSVATGSIYFRITNAAGNVRVFSGGNIAKPGDGKLEDTDLIFSNTVITFFHPANSGYIYMIRDIRKLIEEVRVNGTSVKPGSSNKLLLTNGNGIGLDPYPNLNTIRIGLNINAGDGITLTEDSSNNSLTISSQLATDEQVAEFISDYLDEHPEATTTIQDGAVTTDKLANNTVTAAKLNSDVTTFSDASTRENIASGDSIKTIWGKIKKWFTDLSSALYPAWNSTVTLTPATNVTFARNRSFRMGNFIILNFAINVSSSIASAGPVFSIPNTNLDASCDIVMSTVSGGGSAILYLRANTSVAEANGVLPEGTYFCNAVVYAPAS